MHAGQSATGLREDKGTAEGTEHVNAADSGAKDEEEGKRIVKGENVVENASNYGAADFNTGTGLGLKQLQLKIIG